MYVAHEGQLLRRTSDGGAAWTDLTPALHSALGSDWLEEIRSLGYNDEGRLFVAAMAGLASCGRMGTRLLASTNDGDDFIEVPLPEDLQRAVVHGLKRGGDGRLFAITNQGLYFEDAEVGVEEKTALRPAGLTLLPAVPNPFNPSTRLAFELPVAGQARLEVHDLLGRCVAVPLDGRLSAGWHEAVFRAEDLASGVYVVRLQANGLVISRKLVLVK